MSTSTEVHNTTLTAPAGTCIYCHDVHRRPGEKLSKEHVIALGLGGRLVIPQASCRRCANITRLFEKDVLRGFMLDARSVGGFPTRRPKERPQTISLQAKQGKRFRSVEIPLSEAVGFLHLPVLERASFVMGKPAVTGVSNNGLETIYFGKPPKDVATTLKTQTIQQTFNFELTSFARMLAKIGYGYAVAQLGPYPLDEVPVLPLILGTADDASTWIGSAPYTLAIEEKKPLHALGLVELSGSAAGYTEVILVALVKLFANTGATGYEVVVRRRRLASQTNPVP